MKRYWAMKTFQNWWDIFLTTSIIGIDQDEINDNYKNYSDENLNHLIQNGLSESIERSFRQFCNWMKPEDLVIIGTGQQTKFNISGIVQVISDYKYNPDGEPRHYRESKILKAIHSLQAIPLQRFSRVARLELIDEIDFHEAIISLINI